MTKSAESHPDSPTNSPVGSEDGEISEVASLGEPGEQISPSDSVAGAPEGESGRADEGPTGPDAVTHEDRQHRRPSKEDVETTG